MHSPAHTLETFAGTEFQLLKGGDGPALLYLHGGNGGGVWYPVLETLAKSHTVYAPEHPGFGLGEKPEWLDHIDDLAYFYLELLAHWNIDEVRIVASSIGGWIALEMALRDQSLIHSLTLLSPAGVKTPGVARPNSFLWSDRVYIAKLFHDQTIVDRLLAQKLSDEDMERKARNRIATARLGRNSRMHSPTLQKWLSRIQVPTLIVSGAEDKVQPPAYCETLNDGLPDSRLHTIPDCGHLPAIEQPQDFLDAYLRFQNDILP